MADTPADFIRQYILGSRQGKSILSSLVAPRNDVQSSQVEFPLKPGVLTERHMASIREVQRKNVALAGGGYRIVEDRYMVRTVEDWSEVRSPSRAARRRRQGHPQRIRYIEKPLSEVRVANGVMFMHPETARRLRETIEAGIESSFRRQCQEAVGLWQGII